MKLQNGFFLIEKDLSEEGEKGYVLRLEPQHAIYRAHFPGNPITPGVCIIQMVAELLERMMERLLALKRVVNVKFQHVLSPVEHPTCRVVFRSIEVQEGLWKVKAVVTEAGIQFAQLSLVFEDVADDGTDPR